MQELEMNYDSSLVGYADKKIRAVYTPKVEGVFIAHAVVLEPGQTADQYARTAAEYLCEYLLEELNLKYKPRETYGSSAEDKTLIKYKQRASIAPQVMARWASYNEGKLLSYVPPEDPNTYDPDVHGWSPEAFANFMGKVAPVVVLLNSLAFGATAQAIQAFDDVLATPAAKQAYLDAMSMEGAL